MPNNFVPDVPADWSTQEARGTPYTLRVVAGVAAWVPAVRAPIVTATDTQIVTANSGFTVFIQPN